MTQTKIIVTGGSGLLGSALKRIVDDNTHLKLKYTWHFLSSKDVDLTDKYQTGKCFKDISPKIVIHLAGIVHGAKDNSEKQFDSLIKNSLIHVNVFNACEKLNVPHIITCLSIVLSEDDNVSVKSIESGVSLDSEEHSGYKHSKRLLHALCKSYNIRHQATILCPVNIYGYDDLETSDRIIPSLYRKIRDGEIITSNPDMEREFIFNMDLARIIIKCLSLKRKIEYPIIIGSGEKLSIKSVIGVLSHAIGRKFKINFSGKNKAGSHRTINYNYKKQFPDFKFTKFKDGIQSAVEQNKNNLKGIISFRNITLGEFVFDETTAENIIDVLKTGRLSYGVYSKRFEKNFASMHNCKFGILSNSGTSSLQVAISALKEHYGWDDGDEVLVPAITFVASVNTIIQNNLKPVLVDAHSEYYNINVGEIEKRITTRTRAIMVVHLFGQPCDMDAVLSICKKYNLRLIEDSCETMTAKYKGKVVGSFGDVSCFSTYIAHLLVTGVGGFSLTNDKGLAVIMRSLVNHGRDNIYTSIDDDNFNGNNKDESKHREIIEKRFKFERIGYSYRITELESAVGLVQMDKMINDIKIRKRNAKYLTSKLSKYSQYLQLPSILTDADHVFMIYPVVIKPQDKFLKSDLLFYLEQNNIETRDLMPITTQPAYIDIFKGIDLEKEYPVADYLNKNGFYMGCHQYLKQDDLDYIVDVFDKFISSIK